MGQWREGTWEWSIMWRRDRFVWENEMEQELMQLLVGIAPKLSCLDKRVWRGDVDGLFSVRSAS